MQSVAETAANGKLTEESARRVISVVLVCRRTVSENVSISIRLPSGFFSQLQSLGPLALSPCSCSYRRDTFADRASLIFWLTLFSCSLEKLSSRFTVYRITRSKHFSESVKREWLCKLTFDAIFVNLHKIVWTFT